MKQNPQRKVQKTNKDFIPKEELINNIKDNMRKLKSVWIMQEKRN